MIRGIDHIEIILRDVEPHMAFTRGPKYIGVTGRTTVGLRDPDGWRIQLVDAEHAAPE